jgi:type II secretory pathway component GspD/PulD (secretin)
VATTKFAIDAAFSLLEQQGLARTLSSPSLTVLSGEQAQFQVGGEIPIPESFVPVLGGVTTGGGSTVTTGTTGIFQTINFVPFGIQLTIRPLVEENEMITLDLLPRVVTPDAELTASIKESTGTNVSTTAFQTRSLRTSARLQDGQALLLGGLYSRDTNETRAATPGLSDTPGLGWLFKGFNRSDNATELVVVLNPVVLRPPSPSVPLWQFPDGEELLLGLQKQR